MFRSRRSPHGYRLDSAPRRAAAGVADEARVFGVGDGLHAEEEVVDVDAMDGPFVLLRILGTHEEFAGGNEREFGREIGRHRYGHKDSASTLFDYTFPHAD